MSEKLAQIKKKGSGKVSLKEICRDIVLNSNYTKYTFTAYQSRATLHECGIAVDTTNHIVYVYADFTSLFTDTNDYKTCLTTNFPSSYLPRNLGTTNRDAAHLVTDKDSSIPTNAFALGVVSSVMGIMKTKSQTVSSGEKYILYGAYTYV